MLYLPFQSHQREILLPCFTSEPDIYLLYRCPPSVSVSEILLLISFTVKKRFFTAHNSKHFAKNQRVSSSLYTQYSRYTLSTIGTAGTLKSSRCFRFSRYTLYTWICDVIFCETFYCSH